MSVNFSDMDLLIIHGHFRKKINELERIKSVKDKPILDSDIDTDLQLYLSITEKIEEHNPKMISLR